MKGSKFTKEQIAFTMHQVDTGTSVEGVCHKVGISQGTFYAWKKKYGVQGYLSYGAFANLKKRIKNLNSYGRSQRKQGHVASCPKKKALRPTQRKQLDGHLIERYRVSIQRACKVYMQIRSGWYKKPKGKPLDRPLKAHMREIEATRVQFGLAYLYTHSARRLDRKSQKTLSSL